MKKWIVLFAVLMLAAGTAMADVSNEVIVGLEADSIDKATDNTGADITSKVENDQSQFVVQYTHFFSPLKDDGKPIELRRFYQHPSTLSAGLTFFGSEEKDSTPPLPTDTAETKASVLLLGGEFYFPTNTGLFLNIGMGSGTRKVSPNGVPDPDIDITVGQFGLGVRQYIGDSFALHLRLDSESTEMKQTGITMKDDRSVAYLGGRGVIADVVGLALELGGGERELDAGGVITKFDVAAVNFEITGYFGKHFSVRLAIEAEEEERLGDAPGNEHINTVGTSILGFRYWFSETFGLDLPLYSEKTEHKVGSVTTDSTTQSGMGLYASFRF